MNLSSAGWMLLLMTSPIVTFAEVSSGPAKINPRKSARRIELKTENRPFTLGGAIQVRVTYSNPEQSAWRLERPEASGSVIVKYRVAGEASPSRMAFSLQKAGSKEIKLSDGSTRLVQLLPPQVEMLIKPGEQHEFAVDVFAGWTEDLVPGRYEVWVEDRLEGLHSNRCAFTIEFRKDSIPLLLNTASREDLGPAMRKWCVKWLQKVKPDFVLKDKVESDTAEGRNQIREDNAAAIRAFKEFWEGAKGSRAIETLFSNPASQRLTPERPKE